MDNTEKEKIEEVHRSLGIHDWLYRHVNKAKKNGKERYFLSPEPNDSAVRICEFCDVIQYADDSQFKYINPLLSRAHRKGMKRLRRYRQWRIQR